MKSEALEPMYGWLLLVALVIFPIVLGLSRRLYKKWRIRQHMKRIPGPLLGVIYPEVKRK